MNDTKKKEAKLDSALNVFLFIGFYTLLFLGETIVESRAYQTLYDFVFPPPKPRIPPGGFVKPIGDLKWDNETDETKQ